MSRYELMEDQIWAHDPNDQNPVMNGWSFIGYADEVLPSLQSRGIEVIAASMWDGACNELHVCSVPGQTFKGWELIVCRVANSLLGYIAAIDPDDAFAGFGTKDNPMSYGMHILTWFGPGERYPGAAAALRGIA